MEHNGNRFGRLLGSQRALRSPVNDHVDVKTDKLRRQVGLPFRSISRVSRLDNNGLSLNVAELVQTLQECFGATGEALSVRYPIRGTFFGCCASAVTATASRITTNRIDKTPAFFIADTMCALRGR